MEVRGVLSHIDEIVKMKIKNALVQNPFKYLYTVPRRSKDKKYD